MVRHGVGGDQAVTAAGQGDGRVQKASAHFAPWGRGNGNKDPIISSTTMAHEALRVMKRIDAEERVEHILEDKYVSANPKVAKLNELIVRKLNLMASNRAQWLRASAESAPNANVNIALMNVSNLKKQVLRLQNAIEEAGEIYVPLPQEFEDMPDP